jgi:hypothetical protein
MNEAEADAIVKLSMLNRDRVTTAASCGCFHCQSIFASDEVREWVDNGQTALCPRCGIDSVLPGITDFETLASLHHHRFDVTSPNDQGRVTKDGPRKVRAEHAAGE